MIKKIFRFFFKFVFLIDCFYIEVYLLEKKFQVYCVFFDYINDDRIDFIDVKKVEINNVLKIQKYFGYVVKDDLLFI